MTKLTREQYLKVAPLLRFVRTFVPQMVVYLPVVIGYADELREFIPLWVIPALAFVASVATALDKLARELNFYQRLTKKF